MVIYVCCCHCQAQHSVLPVPSPDKCGGLRQKGHKITVKSNTWLIRSRGPGWINDHPWCCWLTGCRWKLYLSLEESSMKRIRNKYIRLSGLDGNLVRQGWGSPDRAAARQDEQHRPQQRFTGVVRGVMWQRWMLQKKLDGSRWSTKEEEACTFDYLVVLICICSIGLFNIVCI